MTKVLIADDDPGILDATKLLLEYEGYEVIIAKDESTVKKSIEENPDMIFLDLNLSGTNGVALAKYLMSQKKSGQIPIILFSANNEIETIAKEAKVCDFLVKPFDIDDMINKIEKHLPHVRN